MYVATFLQVAAELEHNPIVESIDRPHPKLGETVAQLRLDPDPEGGDERLHTDEDKEMDSEV